MVDGAPLVAVELDAGSYPFAFSLEGHFYLHQSFFCFGCILFAVEDQSNFGINHKINVLVSIF